MPIKNKKISSMDTLRQTIADMDKLRQKRRPACELERLPDVGYICPKCRVFIKFHVRQTEPIRCVVTPPSDSATPRKALL